MRATAPGSCHSPRPRLRRTRRGWVLVALAALAGVGGVQAGALAAAEGSGATCPPAAVTDTTTTTTVDAPPTTTTAESAATDQTGATHDGQSCPPDQPPGTATEAVATTTTTTTTTTSTAASPAPASTPAPAAAQAGAGEAPAASQATPAAIPAAAPPSAPAAVPAPAAAPAPALAAVPAPAAALPESPAPGAAGSPRPARAGSPVRRRADQRSRRTDRRGPAAKRRRSGREGASGPVVPGAQAYFPPVSVDWKALTPLAPPPFPGTAAQTFPGPYFLLPIYQAAATQYNVPWQVLAAINEVESGWGRNTGPSVAGAVGWMQFMPSTWRSYGVDANGDGITNPEDPVDAIFAAAAYLRAAGSEKDLGRAIFAYNRSNRYVGLVLRRAVELGSIPDGLLAALTERGRRQAGSILRATGSKGLLDPKAKINSLGRAMLLSDRALARDVLADPNISLYDCGRQDIAAGIIDRRVLEVLRFLAARGLDPTVSSLRCGHGVYTSSGNVSAHSYGAAVDIAAINGSAILGRQGPGSITERTIRELLKLGGGVRPQQIISLMTFAGASNTLAMASHADHIHVGFEPAREIAGL